MEKEKLPRLVIELSNGKRINDIESIRTAKSNSVTIDMTMECLENREARLMQFYSIISSNEYIIVQQDSDKRPLLIKTESIICAFFPRGELL